MTAMCHRAPVEQKRKLVEEDNVVLPFSAIGTATNTAIQKYLNNRKVPQLFIASGDSKFSNYKVTTPASPAMLTRATSLNKDRIEIDRRKRMNARFTVIV